jgi:hypothetical protein
MNLFHILSHHPVFLRCFNIFILPTTRPSEWYLPFRLPKHICMHFSSPVASYISRPSHLPYKHCNNIQWRVQIMKLIILKLCPVYRHFIVLCWNILTTTVYSYTLNVHHFWLLVLFIETTTNKTYLYDETRIGANPESSSCSHGGENVSVAVPGCNAVCTSR